MNRDNSIPEVFNPTIYMNTVGKEVCEVFRLHNKDYSSLNIQDLEQQEYLSIQKLKLISRTLELGDSFIKSMQNYQTMYKTVKQKSNDQYKQSVHFYKKIKDCLKYIRNNEIRNIDLLNSILDFFGVDSEMQFETYCRNRIFYRKSANDIDNIHLTSLIKRGEKDFENIEHKVIFDKEGLYNWINGRSWEAYVHKKDKFLKLPLFLQQFGVYVFLYPYFSNTVFGCVEWKNDNPIIIITDRGKDLASCWKTLFHEFGHVILHKDIASYDYEKELNGKDIANIEKEANNFVNQYLFNGDSLQKKCFNLAKTKQTSKKQDLSVQYKVKPIFVEYWMRKAKLIPASYISKIEFPHIE